MQRFWPPTRSVTASVQIGADSLKSGRVFEITADPAVELSYLNAADVMKPVARPFAADGVWQFPAASVSALELAIGSD